MEGRSEGKRRLTIREAATLLDVHPNTVRSRIKDGSLQAEKVVTERGPTWMIDPDSLTTNTPPSDSQQLVGRVPEEALTLLAREIVREAGLVRDPADEARVEASKLVVEAAKTQVFISSGSLVGMAAVVGILPMSNRLALFWAAVLILGLSVLAGLSQMFLTASAVAERRESLWWTSLYGLFTLGVGLLMFGAYVLYNIPLESDLRSRDQVVLFAVVMSFVATTAVYGVIRLLRRRRQRARAANQGPPG
jgi:hypothetical protein